MVVNTAHFLQREWSAFYQHERAIHLVCRARSLLLHLHLCAQYLDSRFVFTHTHDPRYLVAHDEPIPAGVTDSEVLMAKSFRIESSGADETADDDDDGGDDEEDGGGGAAPAAVGGGGAAGGGGGGAAAAVRGAVKLRCVLVHDPYNITDAATAPNGALLRQQLHPLPWVPGGLAVTTHNGLLLFGPSARRAPVRITLPAPSAASAVSALKPASVVAAGGVDAARCELVLVLDDGRAVRVSVTPGLRTTAAEAGVLARPSIVTVLASGSVSLPLLFFLAHRGSQ